MFAPGACDGHSLTGAEPDEVCLELGEGGEDIEEHHPNRIDGIVDARSQRELDAAHNESVARADGGKGLVEPRPGPVRAGQPVIGVDALSGDAELFEDGLLSGKILLVSGTAGVADQGDRHGQMCNGKPPLNDRIVVPSM